MSFMAWYVISCRINYFQAYNILVYIDDVSRVHFNAECMHSTTQLQKIHT